MSRIYHLLISSSESSGHVRDLREATSSQPFTQDSSSVGKQNVAAEDDELPIIIWVPRRNDDHHLVDNDRSGRPLPHRGLRELYFFNIMIYCRIKGSVMCV